MGKKKEKRKKKKEKRKKKKEKKGCKFKRRVHNIGIELIWKANNIQKMCKLPIKKIKWIKMKQPQDLSTTSSTNNIIRKVNNTRPKEKNCAYHKLLNSELSGKRPRIMQGL